MTDLPRLLILGNSHIAAPRMAYVSSPEDWPFWDVDFLGLLAGNIGRLHVRDGVLVPDTDEVAAEMKFYNLVRELDIGEYDAFAVVGGFGWRGMAAICADHRSKEFPSMHAGAMHGQGQDCQLVSRDFLQEVLCSRVRNSPAGKLALRIAPLGKPVLMLPEPLPSAECDTPPGRFSDYSDMVRRQDGLHWRQCFQAAAVDVLGDSARIVFWPEIAQQDGVFTRPDLMRGALRLSPHAQEPQPETDYAHGNQDYGRLVLDQIMAALPGG
ncbi:hypothetical protein PAF17_04075 [Paracoccus sp. Z330]|uniref:Alpha/beta hydrolase n=1 Tax=Paracoccus onchidii TaxID=3017813 RepID=A0ABT4ZBD9_9RHOB|nr:hypothetical protein [Paracoccus onchidii]MDB6176679.1 hypothetical protein [Paracoccus onchidii]